MKRWDVINDVFNAKNDLSANKFVFNSYYEINEETTSEYEQEEYKYIANNKPLLEYYEMIQKYNREFADILNVPYGKRWTRTTVLLE